MALEKLVMVPLALGGGTYVIRDIATEEKKRATREMRPEMAAPRRPQQARKPEKKAKTSKKRVMRIKTQANRHR